MSIVGRGMIGVVSTEALSLAHGLFKRATFFTHATNNLVNSFQEQTLTELNLAKKRNRPTQLLIYYD